MKKKYGGIVPKKPPLISKVIFTSYLYCQCKYWLLGQLRQLIYNWYLTHISVNCQWKVWIRCYSVIVFIQRFAFDVRIMNELILILLIGLWERYFLFSFLVLYAPSPIHLCLKIVRTCLMINYPMPLQYFGWWQQGGQKPKGPLEALRPKLQVLIKCSFLASPLIFFLNCYYIAISSMHSRLKLMFLLRLWYLFFFPNDQNVALSIDTFPIWCEHFQIIQYGSFHNLFCTFAPLGSF